MQHHAGPDELRARAGAVRDVARGARRRCRSPAGSANGRQPSVSVAALVAGSASLVLAVARVRARRARRGARSASAQASARSTSRRTPRASHWSACTARTDPLVVPRGLQRRRRWRVPGIGALVAAAAIAPRRAFRRRRAQCSPLVALARRASAPARRTATTAPPRRSLVRPPRAAARARRGGVLHAARRGGRGRLERRLPLALARRPAAVAALGYTAFSLAMATSRIVGDRLERALRPGRRWRAAAA